jgi:hypothetical protein
MESARWIAAPILAITLALTACGGDRHTASQTGAAANGRTTVAAPPTKPPSKIQVTAALPTTPPPGKKVIFLQCELPACERYVPGVKSAAAALGWSAKIEVFKNANPGAGLQQAINERPDYIAITSRSPAFRRSRSSPNSRPPPRRRSP